MIIDDLDIYKEFDDIIFQNRKLNQWIEIGPFRIYVRTTNRAIDNEIKHTIDIASIDAVHKGTRMFKQVLKYIEKAAHDNNYDGVYIESILNEWLPEKLKQYGYKQVNKSLNNINMYKSTK